ncbi:SPOR domain-containing protein [Glacieibacterium megasporae]|uniref:SPOR domain-containing protein n=1 Tax=Glacieibacterium megasporae TaxID=2835787 RepID=UPI001C1E6719|nr:SPOR domain-containing protein [Polymorphobacter megasporae]UAJ09573.1 SPOR domain-containing protein [Polymorphobacter megasporae]
MDAVKVALASVALLLVAAKRVPVPVTAAPAAAPGPSIKQGVELWRAGDYPGAVAMWQPFANAGDPDAMFNIGQAYKLGRGVPIDAAVARDWYRKAAVKGHLPAQANLGIALFQAGEKPESIKWLRTAADRGEARAQYVLGIAAFNGDGLPRSQSLGYAYLLRAQASGLPQAVTALGSITPGLSPADRTAGEAVAASLAAGAGVPPALAAATGPRMVAPIRTPPTAVEIAAMRATSAPTQPPAQVSAQARTPVVTPPNPVPTVGTPGMATASNVPMSSAQSRIASVDTSRTTTVTRTTTPPVRATPPEVIAARPIPQPTPAQADAAAAARVANPAFQAAPAHALPTTPATAPSAIATTDVPASKPVALAPARTASADPLATAPARTVTTLSTKAATAAPAKPVQTATLKPFETIDKPVTRKPDGWRVQLGAFSARKLADNAWASVKESAAPAKPIFATDGPVVKLQMGPYATRDAAKAACAKLTEVGKACFVTTG